MGQFVVWQGKRYLVKSCFQDSALIMGSNIFGDWWVTIFDDSVKVFGERNVPATEVTSWEPDTYAKGVVPHLEGEWVRDDANNGHLEIYDWGNYHLFTGPGTMELTYCEGDESYFQTLLELRNELYSHYHTAYLINLAIQFYEDDNEALG